MDFLKKSYFYFFSFFIFYSCGENFFGVDGEKKSRPLKEILVDPKNSNFVNRLIGAIDKSPQRDIYYDKLLSRFGPEFHEKFSKGFENKTDMLSSLDKMPSLNKKVEDLYQKKYEAAKKNRTTGPQGEKAFKQAVLYSISSKLKRNFYTKDNKFSTDVADSKLSETQAEELFTQMEEYESISDNNLFAGIENASGTSQKDKLLDFFSKPQNRPPSASN